MKKPLTMTAMFVTAFALMLATGCAGVQDMWTPDAPHTRASYGAFSGFKLDDTKNNDIDAEGNYNEKTGDYAIKIKIRNNASDVNASLLPLMRAFSDGLLARVEEMDARTREQAQVGQNIIGSLAELKGIVSEGLAPIKGLSIDVDGPLGKGGVKTGGGN